LAKDFITQLLTVNENARPTAQEALNHTWLREYAKVTVDESVAIGSLNNLKSFRADQTLK
jgi:serine/threonine protein kinase